MEDKLETDIKKQLNIWDKEFFTWFTIRAERTEDNENIHKGFKEYCKVECADNYTLGLKNLIEYKQGDWKYESLYMMFQQAMDKIAELESKINKPKTEQKKEEEEDMF